MPHSQGNLYAIQALAAATGDGVAPADSDAACVGWVPTASPTRTGYPPIGSPRLSHVQLQGDIILGWPSPTVFPKFPATATALSDSVLQAQQARSVASPRNPLNFAYAKGDSIFLHSFRSAYLSPSGARQQILDAITSVYAFCEPVLTLDAPTLPLSPGDQAMASVDISGADGRAIAFTAPVRWFTSDSTIVRVDQSGHLTAVAGGDARISVRYRGKVVDAIVGVVSTSQNEVVLDVRNTTSDLVAPFQFVGWGIMRERSVVVRARTIDSTAFVGYIDVYGQDLYGQAWHLQSYPQLQSDGRTFVASTDFFDNPHNADGTPAAWTTHFGGYFIMKPEIIVRVSLSTGVARWYRVPLQ